MARLIPRKQIEEQQDITGSLTIRENLYLGNDAIISGSLFVSKSFFLGVDTGSKSEITGSVFLTGSLTIDGILKTAAPNTILAVTSSNTLLAVDTQRYAGILAKDFGANVPTLYVSSTDGDDTNDGRTIQYPLRTIKRAAQLAQPGYDGRYGFDTGSIFNGYVIKVQAGTYLEDNPVILPSNTTIWGAGLRITKINAKNPEQDLFYVNSGCYIAEVTMGGLRLWPDQVNPERGFAVAFQPGAFITTSPYVQNCSQISNQENSFTELYEQIPPGGGGLYVNGDVINPDSPLASMVLDAYTQISPNGVGCLVNGRGFIQLVSFFNNFSYYAIRVNNGGHATLNNSNISFGLYGMYASGSRPISGSGGNIEARDRVRASWSVVVDVLNRGLDALPEVTTLNTAEGIRATLPLQYPQLYLSGSEIANTPITKTIEEVSSDFKLVSEIVDKGPKNFPTLLARSSNKGYGFDSPYNILGAQQFTSSIASASDYEVNQISASFGAILGIFANGTGSYDFKSNTSSSIKKTTAVPTLPAISISNELTGSVSSSFEIIIDIINNGLNASPKVTSSNESAIKVGDVEQFTTGVSASLTTISLVSSSFSLIYNILDKGTGSVILPIPNEHKFNYTIKNNNSSSYSWEGVGQNPTITLYRGSTYKFSVSASLGQSGVSYPFFIRTRPISGISEQYDYDKGVINNGDSIGNITFAVPYDAPNELYYIAQNNDSMKGKFHIINNSATPFDLIANTLTYPLVISGSATSSNVDVINGYDILIENIPFIQEETIKFVSSSWSDFDYNETTCKRDIRHIVEAVANDLLLGGNEKSVTAGRLYYEVPSTATTTQKDPTLTAVKYAAGMATKLLKNVTFVEPSNERDAIASSILSSRNFVQTETIAFLSSSWSNFYYNEAKCKRDVGYILDAVATDILYGGNERAVQAGQFYYLYPSLATVEGDGDSEGQLGQTIDGIRFAAGMTTNIVAGKTFQTASIQAVESYDLLRKNKSLIQNETIEFINVAFPQLKYNTEKCKRDVGYIIDAISTDLLYGGIERSVIAGKYYYDYPSQATKTQKVETSGGIRYAKIISEFIVQNTILETPRIITNDERNVKVISGNNITSSYSGSAIQQNSISSSFAIMEGIIKRGANAIPSILAQNSNLNWNVGQPLKVTTNTQITNSFVTPNEVNKLASGYNIVNSILQNGGVEPILTSSLEGLIKVTNGEQITGSVSNPYALTSSISSSFGYVVEIISGGLSKVDPIILNTSASIKVTGTSQWTSDVVGTNVQTASISSSFGSIINVIVSGTAALPTLVQNINSNIKVTSTSQFISSSYSGSLEDVSFVSQSISKVTQIVETGNVDLFAKTIYSSTINTRVGVYQILKENIPFIQDETIAYLSSSWAGFQYDEVKCKRDIGLIISGAAEDLLFGVNSASIVNGQFYYEYPSQATIANDGDTGGQLNQTLDGINYASRLAQKVIQNVVFSLPITQVSASNALLFNNKEFIQNETIAYLSSSWGGFDYNETTCKRDVGYIIDAVRTDLVYGGNERSRQAGLYYFLYPSQATGSQLLQTTDGIKYASNLSQKIISGSIFQLADSDKLEVSRLMRINKSLIANEVVEYVSSSWSGVLYNEAKCKRDVGYIIDAVRTDLVYGGNERTSIAGQFYYQFPSSATVGGVPSTTAQLDPTTTGVEYASRLAQNIIQNKVLVNPSSEVLAAAELVRKNRTFIQQNVIQFISENYPNLNYLVDKCFRDVGFITDGAVTDLVYGGNERSVNSGRFYFKYVSKAIDEQLIETIAGISFGRDLAKLVAIGGKAVEDGFDNVAKIIASGSSSSPILVSNTTDGIRATNINQITSSNNVNLTDRNIVSSSFSTVINIIGNGTGSIPTIISSSFSGLLIGSSSQITSSFTPEINEINKVTSGFNTVISIIGNGTGSIPTLDTNATSSIRRTTSIQFKSTASISENNINNGNIAFNNILQIVQFGTGSIPQMIKNTNGLIKITNTNQYSSSMMVSSSRINSITGSFDSIINILENGTGSLPTIVSNNESLIKVTSTPYYKSSSYNGGESQRIAVSHSISIVTSIIQNGTNNILTNLPTSSYTSSISSSAVLDVYNKLKNHIQFIQDETIAYLSSSWSTASYDEEKCRRDVGLIISGAAEDLIWNSNSSSVVNGRFYYDYPSQAQGAQLNQTLDGVIYASRLAQNIILNRDFALPTSQSNIAYDILLNNKELIQNETIAYISSSWSTHLYSESICKRDIGYIIDAVATDTKWGGNERSIKAGIFYYLYPSEATGSQIEETVTGIKYAKNLSDRLLRNLTFTKVSQAKLQTKELIFNNKSFIANEVIEYVSASWNGFVYNEETCKRDVGYILDAVITDVVYGGNERSIEAGRYYYDYPSQATTTQLGPTLSGIRYAKGMVQQVLKNINYVVPSSSSLFAYNLLLNNKSLIQDETIRFVSSSWSMFGYNEASCSRDTGYIVDAVATDILYGGNERVREAGEYYYLYPSLAIVEGDGNESGQKDQTLDGIKYAKGLAEKIVSNIVLQAPSTSSLLAWNLLRQNKPLIQAETIAYLSSSWTGVDGFYYNEASCSRDVAYIVDNVATDILYGGNERSSKAGEYYYLYPSKAIVGGVPSVNAQKDQTIQGVRFAAGVAQNIISNKVLTSPTQFVSSSVSLMRQNRTFIQNETIQFIDAFYPYLRYNREKCRRDVGYIVDNVSTDLWYGGNERSIIAGDYYYRYPSLATKTEQVIETVAGVNYAKALAKAIVQNTLLQSPQLTFNTDGNIKVGDKQQYLSSSLSAGTAEINKISSSFALVTEIISGGLSLIPTIVSNNDGLIKVSNESQITSSVSASSIEVGITTASFGLIRDIIYWGSASLPDSLANNFNYGFQLSTPTLLHISSVTQSLGSGTYNTQVSNTSASFGNVINIINNGTGSIPTLVANTTGSVKTSGISTITLQTSGSEYEKSRIGNLYGLVMNIVENGTIVIPTLVSNTSSSIKVTNATQITGSAGDRLQARLVSSSFGLVIDILLNGSGSNPIVTGSLTPNTNTKINSAYNLLVSNSAFIVSESIAFMSSSWSSFYYNEASCSRDLGLIISGAAYDLLHGGNSASFVNGKFYLEYPSAATGSQLDQTVTAIRYAGGIAEKIVRNTQLVTASLEVSSSYVSLILNKGFIVSESIAHLSSSWQGFEYSQSKCERDLGYIIDAVATDLLYGGNERSIIAGRYYYDFPSQATDEQLEPTLTGIRHARGTSMNVVVNKQYFTPDSNNLYAYNLIKNNKTFIQEETVAFVNAKWPDLYYIESKCRRDVGYIVDAIATDLLYGGNERSNKAGEFYYLYPSLAITSEQKSETTQAVDYARRLVGEIINSNLIAEPQIVLNTANNIKVTGTTQYSASYSASAYEINRVSSSFALVTNIVENGVGVIPTLIQNTSESIKFTNTNQYITSSEVGTSYEASLISASISIVTNIIANGTGSIASPVVYTTPSTASNVYYAYNLLKENIGFIQNETIAYISSSWSTASYDEAKCKRDVGLIISGAVEDVLFGVDSASIVNGKFYYEYPSEATGSQLAYTLDGIFFASKIAQKVLQNIEYQTSSIERTTAWTLLNQNKSFIQNETIAYISSSWVTGSNSDVAFSYNENICKRDISHIIDAVATDIYYGGNERIRQAGLYYFLYPSAATGSQLDETLDAIRYAGELAQKVIVNTQFFTASIYASASHALMKQNKAFIQEETIAYVSSSWVELHYTESKCRRDVGHLIDAVSTDILYGGNQRSAKAGLYYFLYPSSATGSQLEPTVDAIDYAAGVAKNIIQNNIFVTASAIVSSSVELLRKNREFVQEETMQYLTASWSTFDYNKEKCRRDVGHIIDGVATDLLYGGNERTIMSGEFYYRYPSQATTTQVTQTNEGIRYASRVAQKVAQKIEFVTASVEASASFDLLRKNKSFIQRETIAYVSSSWSNVYYNEASCSRDVGYLVDAAATDVLYGGQERSVTAGYYYYLFPSRATVAGVPSEANQLDPTITGVRYAGRLSKKVILNPVFVEPSGSSVGGSKLLQLNKALIQKETITFLSSSWSTLQYNEISCSRDVGFIIDAVRTDLVYGGNERSIEAGSYYYNIPSVAIKESYTDNGQFGQKKQTVDGINFARGISEKIVAQTQLLRPGTKRIQATERLRNAKDELKQRAIGYTNGAFPYLVYNEASCSRDTGLIVDACATDLFYGGNERAIAAASSYYNGQFGSAKAVITSQKLETLETNRYLRTRAEFIAAGAPLENFGSLIVATGIDYSYNGAGVTFKALPPNQGGSGVANPAFEITELGGGRIYFTSGNQDGDFRIGTGLSINQATGTLVGRTFSKSLFSLVTPFSLALQI